MDTRLFYIYNDLIKISLSKHLLVETINWKCIVITFITVLLGDREGISIYDNVALDDREAPSEKLKAGEGWKVEAHDARPM